MEKLSLECVDVEGSVETCILSEKGTISVCDDDEDDLARLEKENEKIAAERNKMTENTPEARLEVVFFIFFTLMSRFIVKLLNRRKRKKTEKILINPNSGILRPSI